MTSAPFPRWIALGLLVLLACVFASNHIAARLAFDHGVSVMAAVLLRSGIAALAVLGLIRWQRLSLALPRATLARAVVVGLLIALQSVCLYGAVARIPVALALLVFNTAPVVLVLMTWAAGGDRPSPAALGLMGVVFAGLVLALEPWRAMAPGLPGEVAAAGVALAMGASLSFSVAMLATDRWLKGLAGPLRSFLTMAVVTLAIGAAGLTGLAPTGFAWPADAEGVLGVALLTLFYGTAITGLFILLPRLDMGRNAPAMNVEPIAGLALGWTFLGQSVSIVQLTGAVVLIAALITLGALRR